MRKIIIAVMALAMALGGLIACDPGEGGWVGPHAPETAKPHTLRHTGIVADSLVDCCDEMWVESTYVQEAPMKMWTVGGSYIPQALQWLGLTAPEVDIVIIAHGTNNVRDGWDAADLSGYNQYLAAVSSVPCVVMVNFGFSANATPTYKGGAAEGNQWLNTAAANPSPGQTRIVANWRGWSSWAPQWFAEDGIHHSPEGQVKYRDIILSAARTCPQTWGA